MGDNDGSPRISGVSWGRLEVEPGGSFRDARLFPGGAEEWDWGETGTHHRPGIQPADVSPLLVHGVEAVVLSMGMLERLQVCPETLQLLKDRGVAVHCAPTEEAVHLYNKLRKSKRVGGLFHTTC